MFSPLQLFVGLSFPYEGPAPLEAIANGCAFLNPKFNPSKSSKNTDFFKGKPTLREVRGVRDLSPAARPITFKSFDFPNPSPPPLSFLLCCLQLTSQHPYAEVYIGRPHVWTVDIENSAEVERAIRSILSQKVTAGDWKTLKFGAISQMLLHICFYNKGRSPLGAVQTHKLSALLLHSCKHLLTKFAAHSASFNWQTLIP